MQEKFAMKIAEMDKEELEETYGMEEEGEEGKMNEGPSGYGKIDKSVDDYSDDYPKKKTTIAKYGDDETEKMGGSQIDEIDLEELLRELEEETINGTDSESNPGDHANIINIDEAEEEGEYEDEDADGIEDSEDEEIDIENMDENDLKKFIESVIADMVAAGELEGGEGAESEESEEVEINERKKQGYDDREDEKLGMERGKMSSKDLETTKARRDDAGFEKRKMKENYMEGNYRMMEADPASGDAQSVATYLLSNFPDVMKQLSQQGLETLELAKGLMVLGGAAGAGALAKIGQMVGKNAEKSDMAKTNEMEEMKDELEEAYQTIKTIQTELQEVNLFNAKLLYTNKIFKAKTLTESQKVKVLAAFDKAASVKEAKLVFETLSEGFKEKKSPVNESLLRGSASRAAGVADKKPILEVNDQFARWQTLAGIKK
jgi:hypothetical protein